MNKTFTKLTSFALAGALMLTLAAPAFAAAPQNASNNMTRQKISEVADHAIQFDLPTALPSSGTIAVTLPGDFTMGTTTSANWAIAGNVATYTAPALQAANTTYNLLLEGVTNPLAAGNQSITIVASNGDTGSILVPIILDDQIQITARVAQTLTFDVQSNNDGIAITSDNIVGFGDLDSDNARYATDDSLGTTTANTVGSQLFAETNAPGGYFIDVEGDTLTSMQNPTDKIDALAAPDAAPAAGAEAFGLSVVSFAQDAAGTGAVSTLADTVADNFEDYDMTDAAGTPEVLATQTGPVDGDVYDIAYVANIAALTPAGDYATTLTYTMTANF